METFEPLVNILTMLTALSIASERITNVIKLRTTGMRLATSDADAEKARESAIGRRSMAVGIVIAIVLKADLVAILQHANAPWETIGWYGMQGEFWVPGPATDSLASMSVAIVGCIVTGCALGFGSKFWHEMLGTVLELRKVAQGKQVAKSRQAHGAASTPTVNAS